jgi:hypothetical protein
MVNTLIYSIFALLFAIVLCTAVISVLFVRQFQDKMWYLPDKNEKVRTERRTLMCADDCRCSRVPPVPTGADCPPYVVHHSTPAETPT